MKEFDAGKTFPCKRMLVCPRATSFLSYSGQKSHARKNKTSEAAQGLWRSNNYMFQLVIRPKEFFLQHDSNKLQVQERVNNIFWLMQIGIYFESVAYEIIRSSLFN